MVAKRRWFSREPTAEEIEETIADRSLSTVVQWDFEGYLDAMSSDMTISTYWDAYKKVALVRRCINSLGYYSVQKGFETRVSGPDEEIVRKIKAAVDAANRRVNMDDILYSSIVKRHIWGRSAWEIAKDSAGNVVSLVALVSANIEPVVNKTTLLIESYDYKSSSGESKNLPAEKVIYFPLDAFEVHKEGLSSIDPVLNPIRSKLLYERDLTESSKRLWAPIGLFQMDTSGIKGAANKQSAIDGFKNQLKPGVSVVYNSKVEANVIDLKPDLPAIIRAIEKSDEEIIGNWGIPKALVGREKTTSRAALEAAILALYQGPVGWEQRSIKRLLEAQFYDRIVKDMGYDTNLYRVKHWWIPVVQQDSQLIRALAYSVSKGTMSKREMFGILNYEVLDPQIPPLKAAEADAEEEIEDLLDAQGSSDPYGDIREFPEEEEDQQ